MQYLIIVFETTGFALQTESFLKSNEIKYEVMPTPREITLSCGISIRADIDKLNFVIENVKGDKIHAKDIYEASGIGASRKIKKVDM